MAEPHILTVTVDEAGVHEYRIGCPGLDEGDCHGWVSCYPDPCDDDELDRLAENGDDEPVVHGVPHQRIDGEWMRRCGQCFVATHSHLVDAARDLDVPHSGGEVAAGRYEVVIAPDESGDLMAGLVLALADDQVITENSPKASEAGRD